MNWTEIIVSIITLVIAPCFLALTNAAIKRLNAQTAGTKYANVTIEIGDAVSAAVESLNQTVVADLKAKAADGKLTAEEQKQILDTALSKAKSTLTAQTYAYFLEHGKDLTQYLTDQIEAYIAAGKKA